MKIIKVEIILNKFETNLSGYVVRCNQPSTPKPPRPGGRLWKKKWLD